ncbi:hypothetical protein ACIA8O_09870 [Kitasatospora sp. NPDC051853]|uniref:hypothetical protein n=1 Tax=Kitasatospora sp. NPDC051853 TaxID=3364058 RepID=UPI003790252C
MRIARPLAVTAAALTLAVGVPLATGSTSAWAVCSEASPLPAGTPAPKHRGTLAVEALKTLPTRITAGGAPVEVPVRITNRTDAAYRQVEPMISLGHFYDTSTDLQIKQVTVEWRQGKGAWQKLGIQQGCTRGLVNRDVLPRLALEQGESAELTFRIGLVADVPKALDTVMYTVSAQGEDRTESTVHATLKVAPATAKASPTPAPARPSPASAATKASPTAAPTQQADAATELASTGPSTPNTFLALSALGAIAFGAAVLATVRWRRSH